MSAGSMENASSRITGPPTRRTLFRNAWDFDRDFRLFYRNYPDIITKMNIVNGGKDFYIETPSSERILCAKMPGSKPVVFPESGHVVYYENRDVVLREIDGLMN